MTAAGAVSAATLLLCVAVLLAMLSGWMERAGHEYRSRALFGLSCGSCGLAIALAVAAMGATDPGLVP